MSRFPTALREACMIIVAASVLGFLYTAATEKGVFSKQPSPALRALPSSASAPVTISRDQAKAFFDSGEGIFVDSRHEFDYKLEHIKGAINLPLADYAQAKGKLAGLPKEKPLVIYCDGADCNSSVELSAKLFLDGFTNVKIFFGGWSEWKASNFPVGKSGQ